MFKKLKTIFSQKLKRGLPERQPKYTLRGGELVETDEVFKAWTTGDIEKMKTALAEKTNFIDRHFLLMSLVDKSYKQRKDDIELAKLCEEISELHIQEFPDIKPVLEKEFGMLPRVTTFQKYATLLTEQGKFNRAIEVCEIAISHGLNDATKSGFKGRIDRIRKIANKKKI